MGACQGMLKGRFEEATTLLARKQIQRGDTSRAAGVHEDTDVFRRYPCNGRRRAIRALDAECNPRREDPALIRRRIGRQLEHALDRTCYTRTGELDHLRTQPQVSILRKATQGGRLT